MSKEDIITLNNADYVILDIIENAGEKYLYVVGIDEEQMPNGTYKYFKATTENNEYYVEEITNPTILKTVVTLFANNYYQDSINDEQAA